jgi:hypothetical protein
MFGSGLICPLRALSKMRRGMEYETNDAFKDKREVNFIEKAPNYNSYNTYRISSDRSQRQSNQ